MMDATKVSCSSDAFTALSQEILHKGKSLRFQAQGTSMHPLMRNDDILIVDPVEAGKIRVGDVVLCSPTIGSVVVHRVIRKQLTRKGLRFQVQGDQAAQPDGWISQEQIFGRVSAIERDGIRIEMHGLRLRILNWFAVMRTKFGSERSGVSALTVRLAKKLPGFSKFLT